jgi:hypothetical protein
VAAIAFVLTGLWVLSGAHFFWPIIPLIFLFIGLRRHAWQAHHGYYHHNRHQVAPWNAPDPRS